MCKIARDLFGYLLSSYIVEYSIATPTFFSYIYFINFCNFVFMKKTILIFSFIILLFTSMIINIDFYTKENIDYFIEEIYDDQTRYEDVHASDINLTTLLYHNSYNGKEDERNLRNTEGFKNLVLEQPNLLYKSLDIYAEYMIRQLNSRFSYKCKNCKKDLELEEKEYHIMRKEQDKLPPSGSRNQIEFSKYYDLRRDHDKKFYDNDLCKNYNLYNPNNQSFKKLEFWKEIIKSIDIRNELADNLLSLPDNDLNYYILSNYVGWDASEDWAAQLKRAKSQTFEFNEYLKNQNFTGVDNNQDNLSQDPYRSPGDAILLITRAYNYDKSWTPRRSLTELKKFSLLMKSKIIEVNNIN